MQFTIDKGTLDNMLNSLQSFLEKKDMSLVTSHILFNLNGNELTLSATDYEMGLEIKTSLENTQEDGKATANGRKVSEIIRRLLDKDITISTSSENLIIKQGRSSFKLPMFNGDEFPAFPRYEDFSKIELDSSSVTKSLKKIFPAVDTNNPKFELNGALIDIKDYKINFIGTDKKRLAMVSFDNPSIDKLSIIIPKRAIGEIQKLFFDNLELYFNQNSLVIKSGYFLFYTRLINGKFPDYERIVPKDLKHRFTLPKTELIEHIKIVNSISNEIKLIFENQKVVIESISDENSEAITEFECELNLYESVQIAANSKHILDFLTQCEKDSFELAMNESNVPFMLNCDSLQTVVMPIII